MKAVLVPSETPFERIMDHAPGGVVVSNGPGDPKQCAAAIATVPRLMQEPVPILGICLGNQILALAVDPRSLGHQGSNVLSPARHFGRFDFSREDLSRPGEAVYFSIWGRFLIAYPQAWARP